ncbi:3,4-dihydroxy-2-butanone-4-phosphate synthase [Natronobacterium gregoryi]|uniref:3,4-dihydroxy-2-butanone 4-phosphate synthase n=2 Tax=Natronobacterium gregoryi TaxID=44930 RepID=L0AJ09_NATGS|nr:3,4-dihydroxy-2-butanone-4-phosphate synthase [Natronobacterium gregoryi]AFZ73434.1 3,4-dihydroxy-2-butanone 4-phosphate synthase [Natronobacterium gregoryi SP2]ELY68630.1 3,4-dihydroxy-2-butanone 4-phosphate synthase [Natronobacterium gregoryi SP2]PLK20457.1 3,4-dihydroxy-2-butanone-4-phosphate synthase [Natronobacterium gregoryi SP2]SFI71989.1 3,4-dihydroxy 2-butanone 4-phosphate synthase [Natronobacterium gregoryi]
MTGTDHAGPRSDVGVDESDSQPADPIERALESLRAGEPVLVHDAADREGETDLIYHADAVTDDAVGRLRNDAGGLICVAFAHEVAEAFGLPFYTEAVDHPATAGHDLGYDERSSFSLTVNHRDTYTGITDTDRSLTIRSLGDAAANPGETTFSEEFRVPGHVHLLKAAPDLLAQREGHTELGVALADAADLSPAVVVCEMLDDETGEALSPDDARAYATRHDFSYLEGRDILERLG